MSAFEFLYGGQFTLSTQLTNPNFRVSLPHQRSNTASLKNDPFISMSKLRNSCQVHVPAAGNNCGFFTRFDSCLPKYH